MQKTAMDFFQHQDKARKKTSLLLLYYFLAVILIILSVYSATAFIFLYIGHDEVGRSVELLWNDELFCWVAAATAAIIIIGTFWKIFQLRAGGEVIARMLGGEEVNGLTKDLNERKLLNVVEEMSIASGIPVPKVFVLRGEPSINAFAAGFTINDAVVAATDGAIRKLKRDELQGVIAHEFSHIFNGDMKLNLKLTGFLHGILLISLIGYFIMRAAGRSSSRSSSKKGGGQLVIVVFGLALWLIGLIGVFFAKLIKAAISRQREYLADASSVQFTRNPDGIANALKKIGALSYGSRITNESAVVASHMFFANGLPSSFLGLMATHPPLEERIKIIDPSFTGDFKDVKIRADDSVDDMAVSSVQYEEPGVTAPVTQQQIMASVGSPGAQHMQMAMSLLAMIPAVVREQSATVDGAIATLAATMLSDKVDIKEKQLSLASAKAGAEFVRLIGQASVSVSNIPGEARMTLIDTLIPVLRGMSRDQYNMMKAVLDAMMQADNEVDLFEYMIKKIVFRNIDRAHIPVRKAIVQYYDINPLIGDCVNLFSCIAYWGTDDITDAKQAFSRGAAVISSKPLAISGLDQCGLGLVDQSLNAIDESSPMVKQKVIEACVACVLHDGKISPEESQLLRAICDALGCPLPPITAGVSRAA